MDTCILASAKRKRPALNMPDKPEEFFDRLFKTPRLEALRSRVLAKTA